MMRQSSSRNHKNKGLRTRSVLQICILGAVCFWLLYQLKHTYDKKRAFDERGSRGVNTMADDRLDTVRLGRKDLPEGQITVTSREAGNKEDENEEADEEEDQELKKLDAEHQEDVDDAIDEQDHEKEDEQDDQERGGDEERGNNEEEPELGEESNEEDNERRNDREEEIEFSDEQENEQGSSNKAHEESYRKDDASSSSRTRDENDSMHEKQTNFIEERGVDKEQITKAQDDGSANVNSSDVAGVDTTGNVSIPTNTPSTEQRVLRDATNDKDKSVSASDDHSQLNVNSTTLSPFENQEKLQADSSVVVASNQTEVGVNSTNSDVMADNVPVQNRSLDNSAVEHQRIDVQVEIPKLELNDTKEEAVHNRTDEPEISENRSKEHLDMNEIEDSVPGENNGSSAHEVVTDAEREARIDLSTLPDVQSEAISMEERAAE